MQGELDFASALTERVGLLEDLEESAIDLDACRDQILEMVTLHVVIR